MKSALAERIHKRLRTSMMSRIDMLLELKLAARVLEHGTYLGSCPYCHRGEIYLMADTNTAINIGELGNDGCSCRDLVQQV